LFVQSTSVLATAHKVRIRRDFIAQFRGALDFEPTGPKGERLPADKERFRPAVGEDGIFLFFC
jgi:hypothetical protein